MKPYVSFMQLFRNFISFISSFNILSWNILPYDMRALDGFNLIPRVL